MNRKTLNAIISLTVLVISVFVFGIFASAGVGNSTSHSSSSKSSSRSYSSSHSSSGYSSGSHYYGGGGIGIGGIIVLLIIYFIYKKYIKNGNKIISDVTNAINDSLDLDGVGQTAATGDNNIAALKQKDPNFSEEKFISKVNNMYIQLQEAWAKKNWKSIRPFESDELFNMHAKQLQEYIDSNTTNVVENICVTQSYILCYKNDGVNDIIEVALGARINDYIINDSDKKVIKGDPDEEINISYILTMIRKDGVLTSADKSIEATQCPNCGANVSINASGECEYCGSAVSKGSYDWVISNLEVVEQC